MENYIYLLYATEMLFIIISYYLTNRNILSPSFISFCMFFLATSCVMVNLDFWDVSYSFETFLLVLCGFLTMLLPELLVIYFEKLRHKTYKTKKYIINTENSPITIDKILLLGMICLSITSVIIMFYDVFFINSNYSSAGLNSIGIIKHSEEGLSILSRLANRIAWILLIVSLYVVVYNVSIGRKLTSYNYKEFIPIIMAFVAIFISGNRMALVKVFGMIYVFYITFNINYANKKENISLYKVFKKFSLLGTFVVLLFYLLRGITKVNSTAAERDFVDYITYYIGSPVYLLDKFLLTFNELYYSDRPFGSMTFSSLYNMVGYEIDYYNFYIYVGGQSGFAGNEFSWFQRPLVDFGVFGMFLFTFVIYFVFSLILYRYVLYKRSIMATIIYGYYFYIFLTSFYYCQTTFALSFNNILYISIAYILLRLIKITRVRSCYYE